MRTATRLTQLTAVTAVAISLAACGSSSSNGVKSSAGTAKTSPSAAPTSSEAPSTAAGSDGATDAKTLVHQARSAYKTAKSAHLVGTIVSGSSQQKMDIRGAIDGSNQEITSDQGSKGKATVRVVAKGKDYIKGNTAFWKTTGAPAATAAKIADKWVIAPPSTATSLNSISISSFLDEAIGPKTLSDTELATGKATKSTLDGKPVWIISDSTKSTVNGQLTLAEDTKYLLKLVTTGGSSGDMNFTISDWDSQPKITAPPNPLDPKTISK